MGNLIGVFECRIDEKGRLMLPSALKKQLMPVLGETFYLKKSVFHNYLELFPQDEWERESKPVRELNRYLLKESNFSRGFVAGVKAVELDSAGRLQIPKDFCVFAGIEKDVVVAAAFNSVEIWNKDHYEKVLAETLPNMAALAEEVLGNKQKPDSAPGNVP